MSKRDLEQVSMFLEVYQCLLLLCMCSSLLLADAEIYMQ